MSSDTPLKARVEQAVQMLDEMARASEADAQKYVRSDRIFPIHRSAAQAYAAAAQLVRRLADIGSVS